MTSCFRSSLCAAGLALTAACATPHWYDYSFSPSPLEAEVQTSADPGAELRVLVSILGVAHGKDKEPDQVEVRMLLENLGTTPVKLLTDSLSLCSADLQMFGRPRILPAEVPILKAGQGTTVDLAFPFPGREQPTDLNLRGLNLSWTVSFDDRRVTTGASFQRSDWRAPYDDYPRVHAGAGVEVTTTKE